MKKIIWVMVMMLPGFLFAQSYHFSQFHSTPLLVNPAFTGFNKGGYRVAANYRSQWGQGSPYTTTAVSADFGLLRNKLADGNKLGIGMALLNDKSLEGAIQTNAFSLSTAYNLTLDPDMIHSIGVGFQGVYHQRNIDFSRLTFESQLTSTGFNSSLPIGENIESGTRSYFDVNAGLLYNASLEDKAFFFGASVYNILQRNANYLKEDYKVPIRYTIMGGGDIDVGEAGTVYFSANYQGQASANEITVGAAYGIILPSSQTKKIMAGVWHRINDAIIPYVGFELNGFKTGFSYDYTIGSEKTNARVRNGFEITMLFTAPDRTEQRRLIPWY